MNGAEEQATEGMGKPIYLVLFVLIVIIGFVIFYGNRSENPEDVLDESTAENGDLPPEADDAIAVSVEPSSKGRVVLSGSIDLPTPCHTLIPDASYVMGDNDIPLEVQVRFTTEASDDPCAQVITPTPFEVDVRGGDETKYVFFLDGAMVPIRVLE